MGTHSSERSDSKRTKDFAQESRPFTTHESLHTGAAVARTEINSLAVIIPISNKLAHRESYERYQSL